MDFEVTKSRTLRLRLLDWDCEQVWSPSPECECLTWDCLVRLDGRR